MEQPVQEMSLITTMLKWLHKITISSHEKQERHWEEPHGLLKAKIPLVRYWLFSFFKSWMTLDFSGKYFKCQVFTSVGYTEMFTNCTFLDKKMTRKIKFLKRILTLNHSQSIVLQNAKQNATFKLPLLSSHGHNCSDLGILRILFDSRNHTPCGGTHSNLSLRQVDLKFKVNVGYMLNL